MKDRAAEESMPRSGDDGARRTSPRRAPTAKRSVRDACVASLAFLVTLAACGGNGNGNSFSSGDTSVGRGAESSDAGDEGGGGVFGSSGTGGTSPGVFNTTDGGNRGGGGDAAAPPTQFIDACTTGAPSGLSAQSMKALLAGGSPGSLRYLYPYDGTVFPRGLISPTLMWDGATATYVYVHIKSQLFEYKGCLAPTAAGQVQIPQQVWGSAGALARGASDPFSVSLTVLSGANAIGPIAETIVIAPATLKGSIYYNTYSTKLGGAASGGSGAVLRIPAGGSAQVFLGMTECTGCHAVSANGTRMVAQPVGATIYGAGGATYSLTSGMANPNPLVANAPNASFAGVYPDGSVYLACGHPSASVGPRSTSIGTTNDSGLYDTNTGMAVTGTGIPTTAMMGMFSPDGKMLAFNDYAIGNGHGLATMTYDSASRKAAGYKAVYKDGNSYPGWPFFLPDDNALIFVLGDQADFSGNGLGLNVGGLAGTFGTAKGDLYINDLKSGTSTMLAKAMGFASAQDIASDKTYLPFAAADELHHNFDPTVSPVAAGGYFWVFFDTYRHYGNLGLERQLWGTAIDVSPTGTYTVDPSHPAFYLTGQEGGTGNHRAFTALDPCRAEGTSCLTGVDCCKGLCTNGTCGGPPRCSNLDEICTTAKDCCNPDAQCINGFCELPVTR